MNIGIATLDLGEVVVGSRHDCDEHVGDERYYPSGNYVIIVRLVASGEGLKRGRMENASGDSVTANWNTGLHTIKVNKVL